MGVDWIVMIFYLEKIFCGVWEDCILCVCGFSSSLCVLCSSRRRKKEVLVWTEEEIRKEELARRKRFEEETKIEREEKNIVGGHYLLTLFDFERDNTN